MLDQNTDRMWFVIGAVIVGAAIIFIANGTLPELFASVTNSFDGATSIATEGIVNISNYGKLSHRYPVHYDKYIDFYTDGALKPNPGGYWYTTIGKIEVLPNTTYYFTAKDDTLTDPIVSMFDQNDEFLGYERIGGYFKEGVEFTTTSDTAYIYVGAGDKRLAWNEKMTQGSAVQDWILIERGDN